MIGGLILAVIAAALINLGFLLQHHGLATPADGAVASLRASLRSRSWLAGQCLGWLGFAGQILAVALAPLSLVQAFAAGGLALCVPLAAGIFGHRVARGQVVAVLLIAAALAVLPIAYATAHDRLHGDRLMIAGSVVVLLGCACAAAPSASARAIAAGAFYGVADAAIKAISVGWRLHGTGAVLSGWTVVAALATFAGFLSFQAALRAGSAVAAISLMTALTALVAVGCGLLAFGESLGGDAFVVLAHGLAIAVVLGCIPALAAAQQEIAGAGPVRERPERNLGATPSAASGPGQRAGGGEHQAFEPRAGTGGAIEHDLAEGDVAREREGDLGGQQQQAQGEHHGEQAAAPRAGQGPRAQALQHRSGEESGRRPGDEHAGQRLGIEPGQLQQRQRVADARSGAEPAQPAQRV